MSKKSKNPALDTDIDAIAKDDKPKRKKRTKKVVKKVAKKVVRKATNKRKAAPRKPKAPTSAKRFAGALKRLAQVQGNLDKLVSDIAGQPVSTTDTEPMDASQPLGAVLQNAPDDISAAAENVQRRVEDLRELLNL